MTDVLDWADIGAKLRQARMAAGLSQDQLAQAVGLGRTMVVRAESGTRRLDARELSRISQVLQLPLSHFLTRAPEVLSRRTELVEDADTDAARNVYRLEAELASWLRDVRQLIECNLLVAREPVRYDGPVRNADEARVAARWLRAHLKRDDTPLGPLLEECQRAGQLVLVADVPGEGASVLDGDVAVCVVSCRSDPGRRRATAAHELGHMVIGDEYSTDLGVHSSREDRERTVDAFAAEFLLPTSALRRIGSTGSLEDVRRELVRLAAMYRTSWSLVLRQAELAKVIDNRQRLASRVPTRAELLDAVGWEPAPDLDRLRVSPDVAVAVMRGWREGLITPGRAAEITRGQISEEDLVLDVDDSDEP